MNLQKKANSFAQYKVGVLNFLLCKRTKLNYGY